MNSSSKLRIEHNPSGILTAGSFLHVVLKRLLKIIFVAFGCIHLIGGPYAVVQLFAWSNMLVSYSQKTSIAEAVVDTFSGEKPCELCKKINIAKSSDTKEQKPEPVQLTKKFFQDLFEPTQIRLSNPSSSPLPSTDFPALAAAHSCALPGPPVPPPRA